jgi:hypothetical protein
MTLFNSYYPPQDHNFHEGERLTSFYRNYETVTDCVCEDVGSDPWGRNFADISKLCVPSLIILLHQMHQSILSLQEQVEYLKDPERYEYYTDDQIEKFNKQDN